MAKLSVLSTAFLLLLVLCLSFSSENQADRRVLVLLDEFSLKSFHSIFFNFLKSCGFDLDFKLANDPKLSIQRYRQYLYDALILFSRSAYRLGASLDVNNILDFVDSGHDLILATNESASDLIRHPATEFGLDFDAVMSILLAIILQ